MIKARIEEITREVTKIVPVPVQTWKGWNPRELFQGWFSYLGGFKTPVGLVPRRTLGPASSYLAPCHYL